MDATKGKILNKVRQYFSKRPEIKVSYLFGSRSYGKGTKLSDIDIAILIDESQARKDHPYGYKAKVLTDLIKMLNTDNVDLVILNQAPSLLKHRVIYYGELIFSRDERERINFQVKTIDEYDDVKRLLSAHR